MTKQEFIQEAALRMICAHPDYSTVKIADDAEELATFLFDEPYPHSDQVRPVPTVSDLSNESVERLLLEIDKMDEETAKKEREEEERRWGRRSRRQKSGYAVRLTKVFDKQGIKSVGDLLERGHREFMRMPNVGQLCVEMVDRILQNLYGVKVTDW